MNQNDVALVLWLIDEATDSAPGHRSRETLRALRKRLLEITGPR